MKTMIEFDQLVKRFKRTTAVDGLSLSVPEGSILAFLGPNGAGKTTTIKTMLNLYQPDAGSVRVLGVDSRQLKPEQFRSIGYVSENQRMPEWMTVGGFLSYCKPMYPTWDDAFCERLREQFALPRDKKLKAPSRGMKMKAALLSSLAYRPKLVVLDEPFSGLDPLVRDEFIRGMLELTEEEGWTVFISSHDIDEVERLCDSVAVIDERQMCLSESVDALQARFRRVEIQCSAAISTPSVPPESWVHLEVQGRTASWVESAFENDAELRNQIEAVIPEVQRVQVVPLSLREIFISLARSFRLKHGNGGGNPFRSKEDVA